MLNWGGVTTVHSSAGSWIPLTFVTETSPHSAGRRQEEDRLNNMQDASQNLELVRFPARIPETPGQPPWDTSL